MENIWHFSDIFVGNSVILDSEVCSIHGVARCNLDRNNETMKSWNHFWVCWHLETSVQPFIVQIEVQVQILYSLECSPQIPLEPFV